MNAPYAEIFKKKLKPLVYVLLPNDCHDFDGFPLNAIKNAVFAAHAAPVAPSDIRSGIQKRLRCEPFEVVKKRGVVRGLKPNGTKSYSKVF